MNYLIKQSHLDHKTRYNIRKKLENHQTTHDTAISIHRQYCKMTSFLHVLPDFYIIGVEKAGTSSLFGYLTQHPYAYAPISKEINFYSKYYSKGIDWYKICFPFKFEKFFKKMINGKFITGEASVRYFDYPHSLNRLKKFTPKAKLILMLRNPIDRAFSEFASTSRTGRETLSFQDAINSEETRTAEEYNKMLKNENYFHETFFRFAYLKRGIYADNLERWFKIFPREQFLIIKSEDFFENPSVVYNRALSFLSLPKWELDEYTIWRRINKSTMDESFRKKLVEYFRPHNERLYKLIGENFHWDE